MMYVFEIFCELFRHSDHKNTQTHSHRHTSAQSPAELEF